MAENRARGTSRVIAACALPFVALLTSLPAEAHGDHEIVADQPVAVTRAALEVSVRKVLVIDDVAGSTHTYTLLESSDGALRAAHGAISDTLVAGRRYALTGVMQGRSVDILSASPVATLQKSIAAQMPAALDGTLRLGHMDFEDGHGEYFFALFTEDGHQKRVPGAELIAELRNGMEVSASGTLDEDGVFSPEQIRINRYAPVASKAALVTKSVTSDTLFVVPIKFPTTNTPPVLYPAEPFTQASLNTAVFAAAPAKSVVEYYKEVSFGQQLMTGVTANDATHWLSAASMPTLDKSGHAQCDIDFISTQGAAAAKAAGFSTAQVTPGFAQPGSGQGSNHVVYVFTQTGFNCGWSGLAYVGYGLAYAKQTSALLVIGHELGHTFGLEHAGSLGCAPNPIGGSCKVTEYGDPFGVMGNIAAMHFNAFQKNLLTWIPDSGVTTHSVGSATYTLSPIESSGGTRYALRIPASANRNYWIEYRQPTGFDSGISATTADGAQIRVARPFEAICSTCDSYSDDTQLLDMVPSTSTFADASLRTGSRFVDAYYGVVIDVLARTASALTVKVTMLAKPTGPDFDASASTDIVWHSDTTGQTSLWLMNGTSSIGAATVLSDPNWKVIREIDFNGDDKTDLLWENATTGQTAIWLLNGLASTSSKVIFADPNWRVQATGDFNGDGKADLLWYNAATGQTAIWLMNGVASSTATVIWPDATWKVVATGDFNGDGRTDLVWRNTGTGQTAIWLMNGTSSIGAAIIFSDPQWSVTLTGDFDGDGKTDLVWRHATTGRTAVWMMNGMSVNGSAYLTSDATWAAKAVGDFDADGKSDILWRSTAGATQITLMNGMTLGTTATISTAANLSVVKLGDFNADGMADILWSDGSTGQTSIWLMNGVTKTSSATMPAPGGWSALSN
jgi:M6 family metalloprotease-like protein